ncbi:hypothetical protein D0X25_21515 [Salmonella enterica subsp. enterica serovar Kentucky]|uniref:Uncharacterized protein n=4 Tax=Salmonella enterica TaxID=28901 RepID=A0A624AGT5_SALER|nr:hypothetical protein LFZ21_05160 [Salmonella enterica subsp. enterica serovar Kentucky str. SA20030505]EAA4486255.1 hypothetical protein [Salmonella enterica]EAA4898390.1 hypothetical protein [Salmonella enterica subsp. enterica serovar Oranienburg]EAA7304563.1 hypothetical protein [Salmonella enterica subsp. enterica serovar Kentucky]EAA7308914.1 hypothetical protein [Salmonella enterica subsp. enterica serovar Duesseldorf]EAA9549884.1 hypothetical protein [Salmonella enterica subsp. enter
MADVEINAADSTKARTENIFLMCLIISPVIFRLSLLLISFISSIVHTSSSFNKQLSLLSESLLK